MTDQLQQFISCILTNISIWRDYSLFIDITENRFVKSNTLIDFYVTTICQVVYTHLDCWFLMTFCAVVIWGYMLGNLQYCQDTLSWHPPNISDCSAGEWREAHKAKQCFLPWFNHIGCMHKRDLTAISYHCCIYAYAAIVQYISAIRLQTLLWTRKHC